MFSDVLPCVVFPGPRDNVGPLLPPYQIKMARCMDVTSVEDELSRIVPLVYRLGCICKDTDLTYESKQQLADEYCHKLFYGGPIRVACGGIKVAH